MAEWPNTVAEAVLRQFERLPSSVKPRTYPNGKREWVPICGIVLSKDSEVEPTCVSIGTGMKCLDASKVPFANGRCLHDWHAEIVSIRALNTFLLLHCLSLATRKGESSPWIRRRTKSETTSDSFQPFTLQDNVKIDMYCSEAPCGDASMEIIMDAQPDSTPWIRNSRADVLHGRGFFSELGVVRRKPGRADAPDTLSKSCSDKLALKQCTSLLAAVSSSLIHPANAYLRYLIIPENRYSATAIERAFSKTGRMAKVEQEQCETSTWIGGYKFQPFEVLTTDRKFEFSRDAAEPAQLTGGSNITAVWTPEFREILIGGTLQGHKQFADRGASVVCRAKTWETACQVAEIIADADISNLLGNTTYSLVKGAHLLQPRRQVKHQLRSTALENWTPNQGDNDFELLKL